MERTPEEQKAWDAHVRRMFELAAASGFADKVARGQAAIARGQRGTHLPGRNR